MPLRYSDSFINDYNPYEQLFTPQSFDRIFEAYNRAKQFQQQRQDFASQKGQELLQYGFNPAQITPELLNQAQGPETIVESPLVTHARKFIAEKKQREQASLSKTQAEARLIGAQAGLFEGQQGAGQFKTIDIGGVPHYLVPTKYGMQPRAVPATPVAVNPETGEQVQLPRGAKVVNPPGAALAQQTISKVDSFMNTLNQYEGILNKLPSGRVAGNAVGIANRLTGAFPEARMERSLSDVMIPMATRVLGGDVGNLSETEQQRAMSAVKLLGGTQTERRQGVQLLRDLLLIKRAEQKKIIQGGIFGQPKTVTQPQVNDDPLGILK